MRLWWQAYLDKAHRGVKNIFSSLIPVMHEAKPAGDLKWVAQVWVRHGTDSFGCFMNTAESV